jgi:hypothetical protein
MKGWLGMGTNDAREQLEACKQVVTKQEKAIESALRMLHTDAHYTDNDPSTGAFWYTSELAAILEEALR